ncbi:MAG: terminase gpP N-terminus-related DNA-binding protein [Thermoanaerobaculia bacterium]
MARHSTKTREEARRLYLTNEVTSVAEIARRLKVKPHTVGLWRKEEDWDGLRLKIDRRAAEKLIEELATERVTLNAQHHKFWNVVMGKMFESAQRAGLKSEEIRTIEKMANILEKGQRGQRLARGLSLDGQTEEQIRAEAAAAQRHIVDVVIEVVKTEVRDEQTRDRIARLLLERLHEDDGGDGGEEAA